jgi:ubiquitin carboxyl-terminal hydrolase 16/45
MKDEGGGTWGSQEGASHRSMSLRGLLRELARKYDQYDDYGQQDAHELLRHLLDSMEMEEKDVVKRLQPEPALNGKKRKASKRPSNAGISPMPSPSPSPAPSAPSSPTKSTFDPIAKESAAQSIASGHAPALEEVAEDKRLVPFVNVLFGGSLASVVVCENCKSVSHCFLPRYSANAQVSHTYEGFLDISLSLKNDQPKPRKVSSYMIDCSTNTDDTARPVQGDRQQTHPRHRLIQ